MIGHYSSDTTGKSLEEYDRAILPMVSPTSVSSKVDEKRQELTHKVFFRTVPSDRQIETLAKYIKDSLKLDTAVVFYEKASEFYSQSGREVFIREYEKIGGKVDKNGDGVIDVRDDESQQNFNDENVRLDSLALNAEEKLKKILNQKKVKAIIVIPSVKTASVAINLAKENNKQLPLFGVGGTSYNPDIIVK